MIKELNELAAKNRRSFSREVEHRLEDGMGALQITKRDQFAMHALSVMCGSNVRDTGTFASPTGRETVAQICYLMADEMMKESARWAQGVAS
ncbi:hypothetical protein [Diaphorobacter caeni]|uniref:hypothetical protein n=1 Tax=Diaphorobacter caeni TaxID=2784387 RepID=UPI001890594E|nr:hypothetical protein [Diaphorobacter caeni]MBF5006883.1 hypothetical protein [Diaphorobacter caeni]